MTVFEPTTPHRDRVVPVLAEHARLSKTGTTSPITMCGCGDWESEVRRVDDPYLYEKHLADALLAAGVVADPEWVAWLAEQVTQVKAVEARIREQIAADIEAIDIVHEPRSYDALRMQADCARIARGDREATTHTTDKGDGHG